MKSPLLGLRLKCRAGIPHITPDRRAPCDEFRDGAGGVAGERRRPWHRCEEGAEMRKEGGQALGVGEGAGPAAVMGTDGG